MSYRVALLSDIELVLRDGTYWTLDLWAKDLEAQAEAVTSVTVLAPIIDKAPEKWALQPLPRTIKVIDSRSSRATVANEVAEADVLQIPGNSTWRRSRRARRFLHLAHSLGKPVVMGISSDRATTHLVNAQGQNLLRRARARMRWLSVKISQHYLSGRCDGVFVVGEGLRRIVKDTNSNVFVGTASWIRKADILPATPAPRDPAILHLCAAARLEPMKAIHLALEALPRVHQPPQASISFTIAGQGPDEGSLRKLATELGLETCVTFAGAFSYPDAFFDFLRGQDIVVLTNLNDEQPRLVFDAISQGCLIVCPDSLPYRALGIPAELLYSRGNVPALTEAIDHAIASIGDASLRDRLRSLASAATIETMHERRRDWISATVLGKSRPAGAVSA